MVLVRALFYASELADWGLSSPTSRGSAQQMARQRGQVSRCHDLVRVVSRKHDDVAIPMKLVFVFDKGKYSGRQLEKAKSEEYCGGCERMEGKGKWKSEPRTENGEVEPKRTWKGALQRVRVRTGRQLNPGEGDWLVRKPSDQVLPLAPCSSTL